jgi:hypothetical protein
MNFYVLHPHLIPRLIIATTFCEQYNDAPHYAFFSVLLSLLPSYVKIFSSVPSCQTWTTPPSWRKTKCHTI